MLRALAATVALSFALIHTPQRIAPQACSLFTQQDAIALMGFTVTLDSAIADPGRCAYNKPVPNPLAAPPGVEIHLLVMPSASAAAARYASFLSAAPSVVVTPAPGVGDEANYRRSPVSIDINSIVFRKGTALISIGTHPIVSDAALKIAALKMIGRL